MSGLIPMRPLQLSRSVCQSCRQRIIRSQRKQRISPLQDTLVQPSQRQSLSTINRVPKLANQSAAAINEAEEENAPRWAHTPERMRAPFKVSPRNNNEDFPVNDDPEKLRQMYIRILGSEDAAESLPEHLRWLAVTHKSFDHGRRGFNDRLAFLGKRFVEMQTTLALVDTPIPDTRRQMLEAPDAFGRRPFVHKATEGLANLARKDHVLTTSRVAQLAHRYDLAAVLRWKPRQVRDMKTSGIDGVLAHTMFAIVGAVALQRGGEVASQMVHSRILRPLNIV